MVDALEEAAYLAHLASCPEDWPTHDEFPDAMADWVGENL